MQIGKVGAENFGRIYFSQAAYEAMRSAGSLKSDIYFLRRMRIKSKNANLYREHGRGYFLSSDGRTYMVGKHPTADEVIEKIDSINGYSSI